MMYLIHGKPHRLLMNGESIEGMFLIFAGIEFGEYLERCIKETTQEGEQ